ncbi:MAG: hypothetical protein ACYC8V_01615 [Caulobacteraceae bacterium]
MAARGERHAVVLAEPAHHGAYAGLDLYLIRPDPKAVDSAYLAAFLARRSVGALLRKTASGGSLARIPKAALADLEVPVPDGRRQRTIAAAAAAFARQRTLFSSLATATATLAECSLERAFEYMA